MSLDAYNWAWCQRGIRPAQKLILLSLADRAGEDHCAFPSIQRLEYDTELNRKTIIEHLGKLNALGFIRDTGKRVGKTRQITVWQLVGVRGREAFNHTDCVAGMQEQGERGPKTESYLKGRGSKSGTLPFSPVNHPVFSAKGSQKRDTESPNESPIDLTDKRSCDRTMRSYENATHNRAPSIPYQQLVDAYHKILPTHPKIKLLTNARKRSLKARWVGQMGQNIQAWRAYLEYVSKSAFLCGRCEPMPGRRLFMADLDWLIKEGNAVKVYEGKYHE